MFKLLLCASLLMPTGYSIHPISSNAYALQSAAVTNGMVYEWKYKIINGKMYKRLYNSTTEEWVGDWIPVWKTSSDSGIIWDM